MRHRVANNIGNITRREIEAFALNVFKALGLEDWQVEWTTVAPSICIRARKLIFICVHTAKFRIYPGYPWQAKEAILHEVAHIFTPDRFHSEDFYREYVKLLMKFMIEESK